MTDHERGDEAGVELQERIRQLVQENARLSAELEWHRRAEEAGLRHETLYRMLAANLPNGAVFVLDSNLRYLMAAGQALGLTGTTPEAFEGRTIWEVLDTETAVSHEANYRRALAGETVVAEQSVDGRTFTTHVVPVRDDAGRIVAALALSYDITASKKLEEALRDSESRFHGAFEHAAIGYALTTPDGCFVEANAAYCRLTGYSLEELRGMRFHELIHPDDRAENLRLIERQLADDIPSFVIENRYVRKDGQAVWVRKSVSKVSAPHGGTKWLLALVEDISQRQKAEQELRRSERIYRAVGEAIPYGVWICDPDGRNTYASQSLLDLLGITQQQCSEFGWGDSLHPEDAERTIAAWKECVRTEGTWDIEHRYRGTDGQYHPILARGIPVRDENGGILCWAGINLDISRLKQAQEDLRLSEERFRVALKNSPVLVYTTDCQLRYTWVFNPAFDLTTAQIVGKTDEELRDPREVRELVALKRSVLETGIGKRQEIQVPHEGVMHSFDMTVEPLRDAKGTITGLTVAAIDITESKRREQQMQEDQMRIELQRRLIEQREQERLAVARDLHDGPVQSLAAINMELQITRDEVRDPAARSELGRVQRNIRDIGRELRETIGELRPSLLQSVGLSRTIRIHLEDFRKKHPRTLVTRRLAPDRGKLSIHTSLGLFRIYQEALNNVAQHSRATRVSIRLSFVGDRAVLEVRDNGRGMEHLPDLIEQTAQGHYGLAGIKERTEAVNGEFRLLSSPGKGTSVIVRIPVDCPPEPAARSRRN